MRSAPGSPCPPVEPVRRRPAPRARLRALAGLAGLLLASPAVPASAGLDVPDSARGESAVSDDEARVEATLVVDRRAHERVFRVGVYFQMDRGWHIYWRNPGQSGLSTELDWSFPGTLGPIAWPAPEVFGEADGFITTYGYADEVLLAQPAQLAANEAGPSTLRVVADFLACEVQCIPGRVELSRELGAPGGAGAAEAALFDRFAARVPVEAAALEARAEVFLSQTAIRPGDRFLAAVGITPLGLASSEGVRAFIPDRTEGVDLEVTGTRPHPFASHGGFVTLAGRAAPDPVEGDQRLGGVLAVRTRDGIRHVVVDAALPRAPAGARVEEVQGPWFEPLAPQAAQVSFAWALLLAFLGGVILNAMPCVLPVLAIKVVGITELAKREQAGGSRLEGVRQGIAYTAGVLVTMAILAAVVIALRSAGMAVGWGFQFQQPLFVAAVSAVLLVFALNLFGVFEFSLDASRLAGVGQERGSTARSFFEGLLAVVVATPCTAPFLGTAVGLAFAGSAALVAGVFLAIGLGLAAPFLLVTLVPGLARWLPRSGGWMIELRRILGFAVLATIVWLLWVVGRTAGVEGMSALLAWLVAIAFATQVYGAAQAAARRGFMASALVAALAVVALAPTLPLAPVASAVGRDGAASLDELAYDPAAIDAQLDSGRPVFVYFTADWCLTCKVNERLVLASDVVRERVDALGVATFKADWTLRDEAIRAELERFGRAGVPMYLVYSPSSPATPELLPELLTVDILVEALERAAPATAGATAERSSS